MARPLGKNAWRGCQRERCLDTWMFWSERQEPEAMGGLCQESPADCRAFIRMLEEIPRLGRAAIECLLQRT